MNERQLWETTMDPARRSLIQINIGEEGDVENKINILMGDDPEPRREWIENNVVFDSDDNFILEGDDEDE
jgi:topoisomerase-4 subunit B